jgi:glycosyltransferase involved in cell wall biosynthesis
MEPLISVIIPCYNHGRYLAHAINSIYNQQQYSNYEIIVVDDGSSDNTKIVTESFPNVKYVYQQNAGLSAARNTGIENCNGRYLIFLDADDWLLPKAMVTNAGYLLNHDEVAFVSGGYEYLYERENQLLEIRKEVNKDHYYRLLEINYIGMHAAVLYQRWVFDFVRYDTTLKACEDYDIYLRIARDFPVIHHTHLIAVYRIHNKNMSADILLMVQSALTVLKNQESGLRNETEREWFNKGLITWQTYYEKELYENLLYQLRTNEVNTNDLKALKRFNKQLYSSFIKKRNDRMIRKYAKKLLPRFMVKLLSSHP